MIRNNAIRVSGAEGYQEELTLYVGVPRVYLHTNASYEVYASRLSRAAGSRTGRAYGHAGVASAPRLGGLALSKARIFLAFTNRSNKP